ncbi:MAG: hypothetical protein ACLQGP_03025 [Isosphaeraceae bacterium]
MRRPRTTIAGLMLAVAAIAGALAAYQHGRRAERSAIGPPPVMVHITRTGKRYHDAGCRFLNHGSTAVRLDQVGARTPCSYCRPPVPVPSSP